jgi:hypothetical protein
MKIAGIVVFVVLLFSFTDAVAQQKQPPPQRPQPTSSPAPNQPSQAERQRAIELQRRDLELRSRALSTLSDQQDGGREIPRAAAIDIRALYRDPTDKELKDLAPLPEDLTKYSKFLDEKRAGIVRLVPDAGCGDNTQVVSATAPCVKYSMPGNGSSYSFRSTNYRITRLSDMRFADGHFYTSGINQIGILVDLGDVALEQVLPGTKGMDFINSFLPAGDIAEAQRFEEQLLAGIERDGFHYSRQARAAEGRTYAVRSVAYRGSSVRSVSGFPYDEMAFDKRFDITVAFRVVRQHDDGSVTFIWKEIARRESPRLKQRSKDKQ